MNMTQFIPTQTHMQNAKSNFFNQFYFSPFYFFIFPTPIFNLNLNSFFKINHKTFQTHHIISKQKQHPVLFKIPYFKTNHKTSYPNNTFQNKNIKTTHFLSTISLFFFFHFLSTLLKRLCITTKYIKSKIYYSMYRWLFSTNLSPFLHHSSANAFARFVSKVKNSKLTCFHI